MEDAPRFAPTLLVALHVPAKKDTRWLEFLIVRVIKAIRYFNLFYNLCKIPDLFKLQPVINAILVTVKIGKMSKLCKI